MLKRTRLCFTWGWDHLACPQCAPISEVWMLTRPFWLAHLGPGWLHIWPTISTVCTILSARAIASAYILARAGRARSSLGIAALSWEASLEAFDWFLLLDVFLIWIRGQGASWVVGDVAVRSRYLVAFSSGLSLSYLLRRAWLLLTLTEPTLWLPLLVHGCNRFLMLPRSVSVSLIGALWVHLIIESSARSMLAWTATRVESLIAAMKISKCLILGH
jgi:hypothetical protein